MSIQGLVDRRRDGAEHPAGVDKETIMRFISIYRLSRERASVPPTKEHMAAMGKLIEESMRSGELLATDGLKATPAPSRVRRAGDELTVTDGPFTEAKEVIGGYAILSAASKADAIEMAKKFLRVAGEGECEIHALHDPSDFA